MFKQFCTVSDSDTSEFVQVWLLQLSLLHGPYKHCAAKGNLKDDLYTVASYSCL